ncbi:MAG: cellulase family glycosylhydrolase [Armatimonadetes bacterium]|nr:cellulase family glycosylhydrolase [Armatimonadota bacterium]
MVTLAAVVLSSAVLSQPSGGVPKSVMDKMTVGVNITRWFCYLADAKDTKHFDSYLLEADIQHLKGIKAKFVRLCVSPEAIYDAGKPNAKNLPYLDKAVKRLNDNGFLVLLDLHDNGQLNLDKPPYNDTGLITFWEKMADHYKGKRLSDVVFEIVNEPVFQKSPEVWYKLQEQTVKAIRLRDPKRTIVVTGTSWGGIDTLVKMKKVDASNLLYSFHCYDPFFFTHQGAEWVGEWPRQLKGVPFPASATSVNKILAQNDSKFRDSLVDYGKAGYDAAYLKSRIKSCMDWGKANKVPVFLGEFGVYPKVAPSADRAVWFKAMRAACESLGCPHAIWGYDDGLGLGRQIKDGKVVLDQVALKAMYR